MGVAGLVVLKKRIKSIESTKKLTKAMALVATSKLKKVRVALYTNKTYFKSYKETMDEVIPALPKDNRYMQKNESKQKLIIVITSDMGMCGAYNNNVIGQLRDATADKTKEYKLLVLGQKGIVLCKRFNFEMVNYDMKLSDVPTLSQAKNIFEFAFGMFSRGEVGEVSVVYTWLKNAIVKEPRELKILPLEFNSDKSDKINEDEFDIEGNEEDLIESIVPSYCSAMMLNAMMNSKASEQSNRMETMNSATRNADDLISGLKLKYNRIRQGAITQEISEIVGGSEAQK
ncbi:MAG: ATP synthase F1 subunit gamma [Clostridium sp.]|uniref:ATP synthase F1 subunit gamma n=1 Tax=Clostridium sp. TaxID=1506 RepID=UPI00305E4F1E